MEKRQIQSLEDYLQRIHEEYEQARKPYVDGMGDKIKRGRSRTISGIAEDLFAELLCTELNNDSLYFFVDQALTCAGKPTVYPDVTVCRLCTDAESYEILYMLDLKMDVGYHRYKESTSGKGSYIEKAGELIANCKHLKDKNDADITAVKQESKGQKSDPNAAKYHFRVNEQACYDMVIITSKNSGSKRKAADMLCLADKQSSNIWVLSEGDHPNEYKNIVDCDFKPRTEHWEELVQKIKEIAHS